MYTIISNYKNNLKKKSNILIQKKFILRSKLHKIIFFKLYETIFLSRYKSTKIRIIYSQFDSKRVKSISNIFNSQNSLKQSSVKDNNHKVLGTTTEKITSIFRYRFRSNQMANQNIRITTYTLRGNEVNRR